MTPANPKRTGDTQMVIPDFEIDAIARVLLPALRTFYASAEGRKAFEEYKNQNLGGK